MAKKAEQKEKDELAEENRKRDRRLEALEEAVKASDCAKKKMEYAKRFVALREEMT